MTDLSTPPAISFDEAAHVYRIDGAAVPSVTGIIAPLRTDGGSESQREYKRQIGKALDAAIQITESGLEIDPDTLSPAVAPFLEAWFAFKKQTGFRVLLNQPIVYSRKLRFAGTPDLIGTRDASLNPDELLDTKCVWTMDDVTAIQTAGYTIAARESLGLRIKRRGGVQLLRDGTFKFYPYTHPNDEHVFLACLSLHAWKAIHK